MKTPATRLAACLFTGLLLASAVPTRGFEARSLVELGLEAERRHEPLTALGHFREAARLAPEDAFLQQKIARQLSDAAFLEEDPAERHRLASEALPYAQRAAELDPRSAVARLSLSVLFGKLAVEGDVRTKIEYARRIRKHAEEALTLDPGYAWASHVLGRWHVELSQIGMAQRAVVAVLFGGLPKASLEEGVRLLEDAVRLEAEAVAHHVELGFAYKRTGRLEEARRCWERALAMPAVEIYDPAARTRAREALEATARS